MHRDDIESALTGRKVSRRWVLRTASLTAGVVAAGTLNSDTGDAQSVGKPPAATAQASDHDPVTGEIFDRDRHHRWDTV